MSDAPIIMGIPYEGSIHTHSLQVMWQGGSNFDFILHGMCAHVLNFVNPNSSNYIDPVKNADWSSRLNEQKYYEIGFEQNWADHGYCNVWVSHANFLVDLSQAMSERRICLNPEIRKSMRLALYMYAEWKKANIKETHRQRGENFGSATGWQMNDPLKYADALTDYFVELWEHDHHTAKGLMTFRVRYDVKDHWDMYYRNIKELLKAQMHNTSWCSEICVMTRDDVVNGFHGQTIPKADLLHFAAEIRKENEYWDSRNEYTLDKYRG